MEVEEHGDAVVIRPRGRITELEAPDLTNEMLERIDGGTRRIIVDLNDVPFMTSSGLGSFMAAYRRGRKKGAVLILADLQPLVRDIVTATNLHKLWPVYKSVEEALAAP